MNNLESLREGIRKLSMSTPNKPKRVLQSRKRKSVDRVSPAIQKQIDQEIAETRKKNQKWLIKFLSDTEKTEASRDRISEYKEAIKQMKTLLDGHETMQKAFWNSLPKNRRVRQKKIGRYETIFAETSIKIFEAKIIEARKTASYFKK